MQCRRAVCLRFRCQHPTPHSCFYPPPNSRTVLDALPAQLQHSSLTQVLSGRFENSTQQSCQDSVCYTVPQPASGCLGLHAQGTVLNSSMVVRVVSDLILVSPRRLARLETTPTGLGKGKGKAAVSHGRHGQAQRPKRLRLEERRGTEHGHSHRSHQPAGIKIVRQNKPPTMLSALPINPSLHSRANSAQLR